jgi:hypothetical protein
VQLVSFYYKNKIYTFQVSWLLFCTRFGQKISLQCVYLEVLTVGCNRNISHLRVRLSQLFHAVIVACESFVCLIMEPVLYPLLIKVRALCYHPSCQNCFHHAMIFVVAKKWASALETDDNSSVTNSPRNCHRLLSFFSLRNYTSCKLLYHTVTHLHSS